MEWTDELSLRLIECYRQNPVLWDPTNKGFKLSKKKIDIWKNIAEEFKCGEGEVKKKIESLLTSYRREMRREGTVRSGMSTEDVYRSKWFAFKAMQFLNDKFRPRKTHNTENDGDFANETQDGVESSLLNTSQEQEENENDESIIKEHGSTAAGPDLTSQTKVKPSAPKVAAKKRQQEDPRLDAAFAIIQNIGEKRARSNEKTECALYGEYVGSQLETFDEHTRAVVKHEIGNILFQAEMGRYKQQSNIQWSNSSTPSYMSHSSSSHSTYYGGQYQNQHFNDWTTALSPNTTTPTPSPSSAAILPANQSNTDRTDGVDRISYI